MDEDEIVDIDVDDEDDDEDEYDTEYKRSMKWDPQRGDFVRNAAGKIQECDGQEAFMTWCLKVSVTERNSCLAYSDEIGVEMDDALFQDDEKTTESMVQRTIEDALMVNPRTESVDNFSFSWNGDVLHGTYDVKGVDWEKPFRIAF